MAQIANQSQQLTLGAVSPRSFYSRIVSCAVGVSFGNPACAYTVRVGQTVRLLGIKLFWQPRDADATKATVFRIMTGTTEPATVSEMLNAWDTILPKLGAGSLDENWYHHYGVTEMSWDMNQLFTGIGRRFGFILQTVMPGNPQYLQASFHISEG